ncbi:hypothetical protein MUK42_07979, partial [Musa troglodytarum]
MIISSLVYYLRPVAQAGAILLYVELHKGPEPLGKEIAEYLCGEKLAMRIKGGLLAAREVSALELYKLESGSPKSNWQLISDIKRRTNTTGLGEEDMLCIMSGPNKDADGSSTVHELTTIQQSILVLVATPWSAVGAAFMINSITTTGNIKDNKNDSVHLQLLVGGPGSISTVE